MDKKDFTYETKCRRCGKITEWYHSSTEKFTWAQFAVSMDDCILEPRQYNCRKCEKHTVQDVVSYGISANK